MRILGLIPLLLLLLGCSRESTKPVKISTDTNTPTIAIETSTVATPSEITLPTWYVFRIKAFHKVTSSDDRSFAMNRFGIPYRRRLSEFPCYCLPDLI